MNTGLGSEPAVGIVACDFDRAAFNAGHISFGFFNNLGLKALAFRKLDIHALKHARPVLRFGSAGAGLNFQEAVGFVMFLIEHALEFEMFDLFLEVVDIGFYRFQRGVIVLFFGHFK